MVESRMIITENDKKSIIKFIDKKFANIDRTQVGCIKLYAHEVQIKEGAVPCKQKSHKKSPEEMEIIYRNVDKLEAKGYITKSNSDWLSQPIIIKEKDGSWRFSINYQKVNSCTHKTAYPLHDMLSILVRLRNARLISILFMNEAFYQIEIEPKSRKYTAFFVKGRGLYEWNRLPFGLRNASATLTSIIDSTKRLIEKRAKDLGLDIPIDDKISIYLNQWLVISESPREHKILLNVLMDVLYEIGIEINRDKSQFAKERINYLGFSLDYEGLHVISDLIKPIINYPRPTNKKQVRSFNGMVSWYRRHLKNIATIQAPLFKICSPKAEWIWTEIEEKAFIDTKKALLNASSLKIPSFKLPFRLYTDSSDTGLGAALVQYDEHNDRQNLITYISRTLTKSESKYTITKRELLSVFWALNKLSWYIEWGKVQIYANSTTLYYLKDHSHLKGQLERLALSFPDCDYEYYTL